jgi:predicted nucleic acid-binding protein
VDWGRKVELFENIRREYEFRAYESRIPELPVTEEVWERAYRLADACRRMGKTAPPHDILIAACARHHGLEIEHDDSHFDLLASL